MTARRMGSLLTAVLLLVAGCSRSEAEVLPEVDQAEAIMSDFVAEVFGPGAASGWTRERQDGITMFCGSCISTVSQTEIRVQGPVDEARRQLLQAAWDMGWDQRYTSGLSVGISYGDFDYYVIEGPITLTIEYRSDLYEADPFTLTVRNECDFEVQAYLWWGRDGDFSGSGVEGVPGVTVSIPPGETEATEIIATEERLVWVPLTNQGVHLADLPVGGTYTLVVGTEACTRPTPASLLVSSGIVAQTMTTLLPDTDYELELGAAREECGPLSASLMVETRGNGGLYGIHMGREFDGRSFLNGLREFWQTYLGAEIASWDLGTTIGLVKAETPDGYTLLANWGEAVDGKSHINIGVVGPCVPFGE